MHELSICYGLMDQVERIAAEQRAVKVVEILLRIGPLSGVEPQLLEHAFPVAAAGSIAEGAVLVIEDMPIRVHCEACDAESEASPNRLLCGHCGGFHTRVVSGDEMLLARLELEREEEAAIGGSSKTTEDTEYTEKSG
jgi:hydrogenase nickel incorporation protein HypA/HybF